jgi:hypothetical protein
MKQSRQMPPKNRIIQHWKMRGWTKTGCMECGVEGYLERAHIIARCENGPDEPDNLVCVCPRCHVMTDGRTKEDWEQKLIGEGLGSLTIGGIRLTPEFFRFLANSQTYHAKEAMRLMFDGDD